MTALSELKQTRASSLLKQAYNSQTSPENGQPRLLYDTNALIGQGMHQTKVYKGNFGPKLVAVKKMNTENTDPATLSEINRLRKLVEITENIVQYYCVEERQESILIAMELFDCNLMECLITKKFELVVPDILLQITKGVAFLHSQFIGNLNLKPENILLRQGYQGKLIAKISDVGIKTKISSIDQTTLLTLAELSVSSGWKAPELETWNSDNNTHDFSADIFSLGCIYYYVISNGGHPYGDSLHRLANIMDYKVLMEVQHFDAETLEFYWLTHIMIQKISERRPTSKMLLNHIAFWPNDLRLKFLLEVGGLLEAHDNCTSAWVHEYNGFLENLGYGPSKLSNECDRLICPDVQNYLKSVGIPDTARHPCEQLLLSIRHLYSNYEKLPKNVKTSLQKLPDGFLNYWTTRFPFLLSTLWVHCEKIRADERLSMFYVSFPGMNKSRPVYWAVVNTYKIPQTIVNFFTPENRSRRRNGVADICK